MPIELAQSKSYLGVEFKWGDPSSPSYTRYTNWDSDVTISGNSFTSQKKLKVTLPEDRGTLSISPATIVLPFGDAISSAVAVGDPAAPVTVTLYEVVLSPDEVSSDTFIVFKGRVTSAVKNYQSKKGLVAYKAVRSLGRLDVPLGMPCNAQCTFQFTGNGCEISPSGLAQTGTLEAFNNQRVAEISGLTQPPFFGGGSVDSYWRKGYVEKDGIRISIKDWNVAYPDIFQLSRLPPASWDGASVTVFPGCDKTAATCADQWNNIDNFGGFGIGMPAYKPIFESGS